jgi:hypothetical protein
MATIEFTDHRDYQNFARSVLRSARYVHAGPSSKFLDAVKSSALSRIRTLKKGATFWRAQHHSGDSEYHPIVPFSRERLKPREDRALEGRANPKGISYLYLANNEYTAIAEMRGWLGSNITVAAFSLKRDVRVVDCTRKYKTTRPGSFDSPNGIVRENAVWMDINDAFSVPVVSGEDIAGYAPTQILAEVFRSTGCCGVKYRSAVGGGHSIALFNPGLAETTERYVIKITSVRYRYEKVGDSENDRPENHWGNNIKVISTDDLEDCAP